MLSTGKANVCRDNTEAGENPTPLHSNGMQSGAHFLLGTVAIM